MKHTGERHILNRNFNSIEEYYNHLMHLKTYKHVSQYTSEKKVLDLGCGSGYGTKILAENSLSLTGVDIDNTAVNYAKSTYNAPNLKFKHISELTDEKYDIITSFQVIEHIKDLNKYLDLISKHLNNNGVVFISTPNAEHRLFPYIQHPWNKYHIKEFSKNSLEKLLSKKFNNIQILNIGSNTVMSELEIKRTFKQKIITLPVTLKIFPRFIKNLLLDLQSIVFKYIKKTISIFKKNNINFQTENPQSNFTSEYTLDDILITSEKTTTTDILAICKK